ncbi:MAG TPA: conjugative transposon protein TraJ [Cyclobacteriaceae bacterium]|nr:conjugative transposon protein TraJ [Cyclobacteriaceae bacterium]
MKIFYRILKMLSPGDGRRVTIFLAASFLPGVLQAQSFTGEIHSLQSVLDQLYDEMLPLCSRLIGVGRGLAAFAALWYISSRVWRHLSNAEPIDFYPLLRPFALGFCIMIFPWVITLMNGVLRPTVTGTAAMVTGSNNAIAYLLKLKEDAIKKTPAWQMYVGPDGSGDRDKWYRYSHPDGTEEGVLDGIGNDIKFAMAKASYNFRNSVKQWMSEILHILYEAAALCINTLRTFYLIVLAIMGPLVFGFAVFDGFQHTLTVWIARYISVFLWLPVANIFGSIIGKIQENMLAVDIQQIVRYGDTFFSATDTAYLIFLVIGIVGYFTVPSVASYIVHAGGGYALLHKSSNVFTGGARMVTTTTMAAAAAASGGMINYLSGDHATRQGQPDVQSASGYMHDKLSGKTSQSQPTNQ